MKRLLTLFTVVLIFTCNSFAAEKIWTKRDTTEPERVEQWFEQLAKTSGTFIQPVGSEGATLATGTTQQTFRMPYACTLLGVRASVSTAPSADMVIDINEAGTTIFGNWVNGAGSTVTNKLVIQSGSETSLDVYLATSPTGSEYVFTDTAIADDAEMTVDIDSTTGGVNLKLTFYTRPTYLPTNY